MSHFFFCIRCYGRTSLHKRKMQNESESGSWTCNATFFVCWQVYLTDVTDWQGHYCSVVVERKSALLCEAIFTLNAWTECTMVMSVSMSLLQNSDNYFLSIISRLFHSVVCRTTGPQTLPKRVLHRVWSSHSAFNFQYSLFSIMPSDRYLRLLPRFSSLLSSLSLNNVFYKAVPTQDVTNPIILPSFCCIMTFFFSFTL